MNSADKESSHWKFGLFYYNKEDKRIFSPKRFGLGWTINFANPLSVSAFLLILIIIGLISQLLK
ncbi:DUF5808 domain-containing protein [Chryseobacterium gwangjuense]|uniref:DUF5808 domain-containing protein n=1 Tax=Chryseobacterium gwangjuense TaxID=1069980 RepID=UPI001E610AF7|nr:DUF5808 domain-containing protein [Chryseobacterium gwangjuense]MCE3075010.1 DUF5808 domain-containing protein [Chryseobacterium gwangjuense]